MTNDKGYPVPMPIDYVVARAAGDLPDISIDANGGLVELINSLDFETAASHALDVVATSLDGSSAAATFVVNVNDAGAKAAHSSMVVVVLRIWLPLNTKRIIFPRWHRLPPNHHVFFFCLTQAYH